jgi:hypothetical protein
MTNWTKEDEALLNQIGIIPQAEEFISDASDKEDQIKRKVALKISLTWTRLLMEELKTDEVTTKLSELIMCDYADLIGLNHVDNASDFVTNIYVQFARFNYFDPDEKGFIKPLYAVYKAIIGDEGGIQPYDDAIDATLEEDFNVDGEIVFGVKLDGINSKLIPYDPERDFLEYADILIRYVNL